MNKYEHMKNWKLCRAIYDPQGLYMVEDEDPGRYKDFFKRKGYGDSGHVLAVVEDIDGKTYVDVKLEGEKEVLEEILELINHFFEKTAK